MLYAPSFVQEKLRKGRRFKRAGRARTAMARGPSKPLTRAARMAQLQAGHSRGMGKMQHLHLFQQDGKARTVMLQSPVPLGLQQARRVWHRETLLLPCKLAGRARTAMLQRLLQDLRLILSST